MCIVQIHCNCAAYRQTMSTHSKTWTTFRHKLMLPMTFPPQKEVFGKSKHLVNCSFGKPGINHTMKTIMVLGAKRSGKTTLINGMINYILGVEWGDNFRYMLIQEETFFTSPQGIDQIDAVCFVTQASLPRLSQTQKYVFDSILSIFGKDISENIQILVTFADGNPPPPVLEALKVAEVPYPKDKNGVSVHFTFNNSVIIAQCPSSGNATNKGLDDSGEEENDDNFDAMFWKMGINSMKKFFRALDTMAPRSLVLTKRF
ncbi:uncharacterized protein LOC132390689 [Hypanus sabinus]|uniref:uncharacterized protein LOC132390689 n=1 Tax=Hypanus sabinus TaxID=79690 RepID=UPI0028C4ABE1|nr:uncharacterized protein LOC132390689 [Hypanus sabinus]